MEKPSAISDEIVRAHIERGVVTGHSFIIDGLNFGRSQDSPLTDEEHAYAQRKLASLLGIPLEDVQEAAASVRSGEQEMALPAEAPALEIEAIREHDERYVRYKVLRRD